MRKDLGVKSWFYPLPVLIIGTYDEDGTPDLMNAAWGGLYESDQVILCLSHSHKTFKNIMAKKAFTVSFAEAKDVVACDYVGIVSGNTVKDKVQRSGLHTSKASHIDAPLVDELSVALECELIKVNEDGNVIGKIVNISVDEKVLTDDKLDPHKFIPISFDPCNNTYRAVKETVADAFKAGKEID